MKRFNFEEINLPLTGLIVGFILSLPLTLRVQEMDFSDDKIVFNLAITRFFLTILSTIVYTIVFGFLGMIAISLLFYGLKLWVHEHSYFASLIVLIAAFSMLYPLLAITYFPDLISSWSGNHNNDDVVYPYYPVN